MKEFWGLKKEDLIENFGEPHETNKNEQTGLDEITYNYSASGDFQPEREETYGLYNDSLVMISTGYKFQENLFKQYELYFSTLLKKWNEDLEIEPTKDTFEDEEKNKVTIWNKSNTEVTLFFSNNPANPQLVVVQTYKPS